MPFHGYSPSRPVPGDLSNAILSPRDFLLILHALVRPIDCSNLFIYSALFLSFLPRIQSSPGVDTHIGRPIIAYIHKQ